jgi:hypothetical protein
MTMLPVVSVLARAGAFAVVLASAAVTLPSTASAFPVAAPTAAPAANLLVPVQDEEQWRRRGPWNDDGDFNNTDPGRPPEDWRRRHHRDGDGWGWNRDPWGDDYPRYHRRRPTVYLDLDLTPQRYIQPRYREVPRRANRLPRAHVAWCFDRYRSYDVYSNSFQPNYGPRRQCRSPYW